MGTRARALEPALGLVLCVGQRKRALLSSTCRRTHRNGVAQGCGSR